MDGGGVEMKTDNPERDLAEAFVNDTGCNLFLTGKAGTGKTTFLRNMKARAAKRMVVTAPTGVAAINAGGVTLHSFFQLPFGPFVPGSKTTRFHYRFNRAKIDVFQSLDLLVIDEISMVRADLLDGVDSVLRHHRRNDLPFGGVQLLMIGDLFQLPPVVKEEDWEILHPYYASPYFFSSNALAKTELITVELTRVYRQSDGRFIELLNRVRSGTVDTVSLDRLNNRHRAGLSSKETEGGISLSTHNRSVDEINASRLQELKGKLQLFSAHIEGEFPVQSYPTASVLKLKTGAQVMFVRNDTTAEKRYFNGKIGWITGADEETIRIRCPGESNEIVVEPETWENIEYTLDKETMEIEEKRIGGFTQYPLRLAWAVTIHKSQGLTFDKAIIDARAAFAPGQVYVALSRCRTLEGMMLSTPLSADTMKVDPTILRFSQEARRIQPSKEQLEAEKIRYQEKLLVACFDFQKLKSLLHNFVMMTSRRSGQVKGVTNLPDLLQSSEKEIFAVGDRFIEQLRGLFSPSVLPSQNPAVLDRIHKASIYFDEKLRLTLGSAIPCLALETDNKSLGKKADFLLKILREELAVKQAAVKSCSDGFSPTNYFRALSSAAVYASGNLKPMVVPTYDESDISHPDLYASLKAWRSAKAQDQGLARYQVLHQKTLIQIAVCLPETVADLKKVKGIGERLAKRYGEELVTLVATYRRERGITSMVLPMPNKAQTAVRKKRSPRKTSKVKIDTKQQSLDFYEKGMTLQEIAQMRGLVLSTIEEHMVHWVQQGKVAIGRLVPGKKRKKIERVLLTMEGIHLGDVKKALGNGFSYGEIKMVQAHMTHLSEDEP